MIVRTTGSSGPDRNYVINVLDTGAPDDGVDTLDVFGSDGVDLILMRQVTSIPCALPECTQENGASTPAFVAVMHADVATASPVSTGQIVTAPDFPVERVNYDARIDGSLRVYGMGGNDTIAIDDIASIATVDGGAGNDEIRVGQIYGLPRVPDNVLAQHAFPTTDTFEGFVSRGASFPLFAMGGTGDDTFFVYANDAAVHVEGGFGTDTLTVRSFARRSDRSVIAHGPLTGGGLEFWLGDPPRDPSVPTPAIIVTPVATPIAEGGPSGTFTVQLASQPTGTVYVIVSLPCSSQEESLFGCAPDRAAAGYPLTGETAEIATTPTTCVPTVLCHQVRFGNTLRVVEHRAVVLVFTPGNWNQPQTVHVLAPDDQVAERDQVVPIAFSLAGAIATNVSIVVGDNDVPAGVAPFAAFAVVGEPPPVRGLGQEALLVAILYPLEKNLALPVPPTTGTIVVEKVVVNDHGATATAVDFAFVVNGVRTQFDADGSVEVIGRAGYLHRDRAAVIAYATTYANCVDMVVPFGARVTCTITNNDRPGTIVVRKVVLNNDGGTEDRGRLRLLGEWHHGAHLRGDRRGRRRPPGRHVHDHRGRRAGLHRHAHELRRPGRRATARPSSARSRTTTCRRCRARSSCARSSSAVLRAQSTSPSR